MKKQNKIALMFSLLAIFSYLGFLFSEKEETIVKVSNETMDFVQVYLLDEDDLLTPLTIYIENDLTLNQKVEMVCAYLSGKHIINGYKPLFNEALIMNEMSLNNQQLMINFNKTFLSYDEENELSVLESLVYSLTSLNEVKTIKIHYLNQELKYMPKTRIKIANKLDRSIGINHFESTPSLHNSNMITMYYKKNDKFIPKSIRINSKVDSIESYVKYLLKDISISSLLLQPMAKEEIKIHDIQYENQVCHIDVNHKMLSSDQEVKDDLMMVLKLALKDQGVKKIKLSVDHQLVKEEAIDQMIAYNVVDFK